MKRQNRFQHCFKLAVLMGLWAAASPALAQQLASQQSPAPTSDPPSSSAKNGREKKDGDVGIVGWWVAISSVKSLEITSKMRSWTVSVYYSSYLFPFFTMFAYCSSRRFFSLLFCVSFVA